LKSISASARIAVTKLKDGVDAAGVEASETGFSLEVD